MQSLISPVGRMVSFNECSYLKSRDHESRHNSYRADDDNPRPTESTPLLQRNPIVQNNPEPVINTLNTVIVVLLLLLLITGIFISIYLLIEQRDILPPVEEPLQLVSYSQWDASNRTLGFSYAPPARYAILTQTSTQQCRDTCGCRTLLHSLKDQYANESSGLPYNFLVSSNGLTFEALGWRRQSLMFPELKNSLIVALIGNFTHTAPGRAQVLQVQRLFDESISQGHLLSSYSIIGKTETHKPLLLYQAFGGMPQWNHSLSDSVF